MSGIGHVMILASAGSGKTYALTNRYVRLLALGAKPERIAALTFTRKAAGEFFDEILKKLAAAAGDEAVAKKLGEQIEVPQMKAADFLKLLRVVTQAMHRLNLGTLDSFFARVVRAFPLELGLGGGFEVLQEHAARLERRKVLRQMFAHTSEDTARQDFIEAFKRATFGTEEKRLGARLDAFLDQHGEIYQAVPDAVYWGQAERIWPDGCDWLVADARGNRAERASALRAALPWATFNEKQRARLEDFFTNLPDWTPGSPLPKPVSYIVENAFKMWPGLAEITIERKRVTLPPDAGLALRALVSGIVGADISRRLETTQGIHAVLRAYDGVYDTLVRRAGKLTFADVQRLLRPDTPDGVRLLTRDAAAEARLFIDWRLDAQIDHWLLDEFQDTSFGQWSVLRNLIDEAVQDPAEARSFFYVGDVKQAIFAWRDGDARLFREIFDQYNAARPGTIREERLDQSWRSGPAVISMVNRVFGDREALARLFPGEAALRWTREWRDHESARLELGGYAALRHAGDKEGRFAETLRIIRETEVLEKGLSVAVLVQKNSTAAELADYLRREGGVPAVAETELHGGTDNPVSCAILALFRVAAHPGDRAAWAHVRMTPLPTILEAEACVTSDDLTRRLLREIHTHGLEETVVAWLHRLEPTLPEDDVFSRERGRQLAEAARLFDETGSRNVAEFVHFVEAHTVRDIDSTTVVRVMTVHKAKGLGFDVVVLPDLEGTKLAGRRRSLAVQRTRDRDVEWVMDLPTSTFYARDPVLAANVAEAEVDACYEELAVLYVAMTRAKRAMYIITEPVGASQSLNFPRLLQETLGGECEYGDPRWYMAINSAAATAEPMSNPKVVETERTARRSSRAPSESRSGAISGRRIFAMDGNGASQFGRQVHGLLAQVEWLPGDAISRWEEVWRSHGPAGEEAIACLKAPDLGEIWAKPKSPRAEAWRELAFEVVLDGIWVTGVFDRVVVAYDEDGQVTQARLYDFKTDRIIGSDYGAAIERHIDQISLYRRVVTKLTGLPATAVVAEVVFTQRAHKLPVPFAI
jgi:ATP-dependent helicase/nuclease subunit A